MSITERLKAAEEQKRLQKETARQKFIAELEAKKTRMKEIALQSPLVGVVVEAAKALNGGYVERYFIDAFDSNNHQVAYYHDNLEKIAHLEVKRCSFGIYWNEKLRARGVTNYIIYDQWDNAEFSIAEDGGISWIKPQSIRDNHPISDVRKTIARSLWEQNPTTIEDLVAEGILHPDIHVAIDFSLKLENPIFFTKKFF